MPARRLGREAAVPVLEESGREPSPGGAANCAVIAASLGAQTRFLGIVDDVAEGQTLRAALTAAGIDAGRPGGDHTAQICGVAFCRQRPLT
jgi:D-beta-D-heptose 7-phosphate kinase/D-beta-D-heptose 1-phosphate adenosyltransferase